MQQKQYQAAIVGLGFIGGGDQVSGDALGQRVEDLPGTHASALAYHPRVNLRGGSSRDPGRRERFTQRTGASAWSDWRQMLDDQPLDILSVATYAPQHAEIVVEAAHRGVRAIFCEKPISQTLSDAENMVEACHQSGTCLLINHTRRFHPHFRRVRDLLHAGELGELTSAHITWSTGRIGNLGTHFLDALRMLTGREIEAVFGLLDVTGRPDCRGPAFRDPGGWGLIKLGGGLMATIDAGEKSTAPNILTFHGTRGRVSIENFDVTIDRRGAAREVWRAADSPPLPTPMDIAIGEIVDFLDGNAPPPEPSGVDALRTLEAIIAWHASDHAGGLLKQLPLQGSDRELAVLSG